MVNTVSLTGNRSFQRVYAKARYALHPLFVTYLMKNRKQINRLGITTGKKIGNAVQRNRAKRVIKAAYAEIAPCLPTGFDIVIVARQAILQIKSKEAAAILSGQFKRLLDNGKIR